MIYLLTAFIFGYCQVTSIWWAGFICVIIIDILFLIMRFDNEN